MALPSITFIEGQGGLGRPLPNNDHISGLLIYTGATLPSGFTASTAKALYSTDDAIAAGIKNDFSDATAATAKYAVTLSGSQGDNVTITVAELTPYTGVTRTTTLCNFNQALAINSTITLAGEIVAAINAATSTHGYTASYASTGLVNITAPKAQGAFLNSGSPLTVSTSGSIGGTITQFGGSGMVAGVTSNQVQWYYQISEFFRLQPKGKLWVGFFAVPGTYTFTEITTMQNTTSGEIRQVGILKDSASAWASGDLTTINTICETNKSNFQPLQALYAANLQATTDITTIGDLTGLTAKNVQTVIGQDGGGLGNFIYQSLGSGKKSITCLGAQLGAVALRKVSESIAWVEKTNLSNGSELETPAFCNGQLVTALSNNALEAINTKRHIFLKKFRGYAGTFFNDSHMAIIQTSDYAYMENNRTICKAERLLYASYVPVLNSPIQFKSDGTLTDTTVAYFENIGSAALDQMVRDSELSAKSVTVNPVQNVLATSTLIITVVLVINGVARQIQIPIGFKPSIA